MPTKNEILKTLPTEVLTFYSFKLSSNLQLTAANSNYETQKSVNSKL